MEHSLIQWEGVVQEVDGKRFFALLQANDGAPPETAWFDYNEVPESDYQYIQVGAVFYWDIMQDDTGECRSVIKFCTDVWTEKDILDIKAKARELFTILNG